MRGAAAESAVLAAGRVAAGTLPAAALAPALAATGDDDRVLALLRRERLGPLGWTLLAGVPGPRAAALRTALAADYYGAARRYVELAGRLEAALASLTAAGVDAIVLKGMALAEPLYGNPAHRPMEDIDLLVARADVARARAALERLGYAAPPDFEDERRARAASMFTRSVGLDRLDLHWDLVDAKSSPVAGRWADGVWARARHAAAGEGTIRVLGPTDALLHACVHLTVNHGLGGLLWRLDIAGMLGAWRDAIDWPLLLHAAEAGRLRSIVYAALRCAESTLAAPLPPGPLDRLRGRGPRAGAIERWLLPRFAGLGTIPYQDYVVPLLAMERGRDVAALLFRRLGV